MKKEAWQAWALLALAALIFTNAAWFYRGRVEAAERAIVKTPAAPCEVIQKPPSDDYYERALPPRKMRLHDDEQCVNGQRLQRIPNGWRRVYPDC